MRLNVDPNYFDYAASTPPFCEAINEYRSVASEFYANPSSMHSSGKRARQKLLELKKSFCDLLRFHDGRLLLCSTGSEANNTVIEGHLRYFPDANVLVAEDVHDSIWYATKKHQNSTRILKIDHDGCVDLKVLERALDKRITLLCINHVCGETGKIHPVRDIAGICYGSGVKLLIDGTQSIGHIPVDLNEIPCAYYTFSGHKFGAVKSSGGVLHRDSEFVPLIFGGNQEWNLRAGTEDIAGLASAVKALRLSLDRLSEEADRLLGLKRLIVKRLKDFPEVTFNTSANSYPGILSLCFSGVTGRAIVGALSLKGFAVSTGSACHASVEEPSRILMAMGRTKDLARGSLRISMGAGTTENAVLELLDALAELRQT